MRSFVSVVIDTALMKEFVFTDFLKAIAKKVSLTQVRIILLSDKKKEVKEAFVQKIKNILTVEDSFFYYKRDTLQKTFSHHGVEMGSDALYITKDKIFAKEAASFGWEILHFDIDVGRGSGKLHEPHLQKFHAKSMAMKENTKGKKRCILALDIDETTLFYRLSVENRKTMLNPAIISLLHEMINHPGLAVSVCFITARKEEVMQLSVVHHETVVKVLHEMMEWHSLLDPAIVPVYFNECKFQQLKMLSDENPDALCVLVDDNPKWTMPFNTKDCPDSMMYILVHSLLHDNGIWKPVVELEVFKNWYAKNEEKIKKSVANSQAFFATPKPVIVPKSIARCCTIM